MNLHVTLSKARFPETFATAPEIERITDFIRSYVKKAKTRGVVVAISGGIDSAVVAFLCKRALGSSGVTGLLLFEDDLRHSSDYADAREIISELDISSMEFRISKIIKAFSYSLGQGGLGQSRITLANIKARIRMVLLYAVANEKDLLVAGTGDRSEELLGYFTKYGDGGVDFMPIAHLYKGRVRDLALKLGIPKRIAEKPSSPNLWRKQRATDELPADYSVLDRILSLLYDSKRRPAEVARTLRISPKIVSEVMKMHEKTRHKRTYPPMIAS